MPLPKANNIFLSNSFLIFVTRFFPALASLLVMIWYSNHLPRATYGAYKQFWIQVNVIYPFICFGLHALIITYSRNLLANILSRIKTVQYLMFVIWMALLSLLFAWLQSSEGFVSALTSFLFILTFSIGIITESLLIVFRRGKTVAITGFLYAAAFCLIHWYGLYGQFSIQVLFSCLLVLNLVRVFVYSCSVLIEVKKDKEGYPHEELNMPSIRSLWLHLGVYDLIQSLSNWIDKFVIALLFTTELTAIYANGAQEVPFLPILLNAAGSSILLQLATSNERHDERKETISLVNHSGRILSSIVFPVFFFLFFFRNELFINILSNKYANSIPIFAMYVLLLPVRAYSFTTILQRNHKGQLINAGALGELLLACALMYPLYNWLGLPGIALSFVISTYLQATFYLVCTGKVLKVSPFELIPLANWGIKLITFGTIFLLLHHYFNIWFTGKMTLIYGAIIMTITIAIALFAEIKRDQRNGSTAAQAKI